MILKDAGLKQIDYQLKNQRYGPRVRNVKVTWPVAKRGHVDRWKNNFVFSEGMVPSK